MLFNLFTSFVWGGVLQKKDQQIRIMICKVFRDCQVRTVCFGQWSGFFSIWSAFKFQLHFAIHCCIWFGFKGRLQEELSLIYKGLNPCVEHIQTLPGHLPHFCSVWLYRLKSYPEGRHLQTCFRNWMCNESPLKGKIYCWSKQLYMKWEVLPWVCRFKPHFLTILIHTAMLTVLLSFSVDPWILCVLQHSGLEEHLFPE